jgi:16S rRNA (guanine527-N7)-methyltransferase
LPKDAIIADMGSGAGFPGVVLAILGWDIIAIESVGKKADFLRELKKELDLDNLEIFNGRLEDFIKNNKNDNIIFTARAFAPLIKILYFVYGVKNSRLFLLKGREIESEILAAKTDFNFDYQLSPSKTGDGFILTVQNIKLFHTK